MVFEGINPVILTLFFVFVVIFLIGGGITSYWLLVRMRYPIVVTILKEVPPYGFVPFKRDRAMLVNTGDSGEELYWLKKTRRYRIGFGKWLGKNSIAWGIGQDGYWYNITFSNLDKKLSEVGLMPIATDMRFAHGSARKLIGSRYDKKSWYDKYGTLVVMGGMAFTILILVAGMWFILDKQADIITEMNAGIKQQQERQASLQEGNILVLEQLNNILSGGGGGFEPIETNGA